MRYFKIISLISIFTVLSVNILAQTESIRGQVIDISGNPIPNATLYVHPFAVNSNSESKGAIDYNILFGNADEKGYFDFEPRVKKFRLCSTNYIRKDVFTPILSGFLCDKSRGIDIDMNSLEDSYIGDVKVSYNFQIVKLNLLQSNLENFINEDKSIKRLSIKLENKFHRKQTHEIPADAIDEKDSSVMLYLPEGKWKITILSKKKKKLSKKTNLVIPRKHSKLPIIQKIIF